MRRTRASYHYAIRRVKKNEEQIIRNRIANCLLHDPTRNFWSEIRKIRNKKPANCRIVDGCANVESVAHLFASQYKELFNSVSYDSHEMQNIVDSVEKSINCDMYGDCVMSCGDVRSAISRLKPHKNDNNGELSSDHFINAGDDLSAHIGFLFSAITSHGTVAHDFSLSTILPIPKIKNVSAVSSDNFRGIALSSIFVKIFENIVMQNYCDKLCTSELQFGFKKNSSTHMCSMILKETLAYYNSRNSNVFCTFLDASKAFDRVNYSKLFKILVDRDLPAYIIRILINMYITQQARVSWSGSLSDFFPILNGVRQGGVLSPLLFCVYIDKLLTRLSQCGTGCYIGLNFVGALAYADDIVLLCPTAAAMRTFLLVCDAFASEFDIKFDALKSKLLVCMPSSRCKQPASYLSSCQFFINDNPIERVDSFLHLGHVITSNLSDKEDILFRRDSFITQANNVL